MIRLALAAMLLAATVPASAAVRVFSGTRANINILNPPGTGRCAPLNTVNIAPGALSSTGTSNFGDYASTQSHCIAGPPTPAIPVREVTAGEFTYAFAAGDAFFGTYSGTATFGIGGIENLIVTGGTGRFLGASGTVVSQGTLVFAPNPVGPGNVGVFDGTVFGELNLPAVPEPATWAMMIAGFGLVGGAVRRQRSLAAA